jgi:hypothetical protein
MGRMLQVQSGSAALHVPQPNPGSGREVGDHRTAFDAWFDHSWILGGLEPGPGWF